MLTGIPAFEACWLASRTDYPTGPEDNLLIAQAMGKLVDRYASPLEVEACLPSHLRHLFERLATAYFHGYTPAPAEPSPSPIDGTAKQDRQAQQSISAAVDRVRQLAQQVQQRCYQQRCHMPLEEADTLIVDFPEGWRESQRLP